MAMNVILFKRKVSRDRVGEVVADGSGTQL